MCRNWFVPNWILHVWSKLLLVLNNCGVLDICLDQSQISFAVFLIKLTVNIFTPEACWFWHISCVSTCNKVLVTVLFLLIWRANRPGHFLPDSRVICRRFRHIKYSPLFSDVMLCRAEVSLGKFLDSKACTRLCLAELPVLATFVWTRWSKSGSAGEYMFVFCKKPVVEVSDPPMSQ